MNWNLVLKNSPSGGASLRRIALTMATYSRICETGLEILASYQFSTVTWCETPSPSTIRPPENSSIVAAACAIVAGASHCVALHSFAAACHTQPCRPLQVAAEPSIEQPVLVFIEPELSTTRRKYGAIAVA